MVTSVCTCYKCNYRFNYEYIAGVSYHSIRLGNKRIFRCPKCKTLQKFDLTTKGPNPSLKTYGDSSELGIGVSIWALMLAPTFVLSALGSFSFFIFPQVIYIPFVLIFLGLVWIFGYLIYLIMSVGPKISGTKKGGK